MENNQESTIANAVISKNPPNLTTADFSVGNITETSAVLTGKGKYQGTVNVSFTIQVPEIDIILSKTSVNLKVGEEDSVVVTNGASLTNLTAISSNDTIASATLSTNTITIQAQAVGSATIKVNSDNAETEKEISVTITADEQVGRNNQPKSEQKVFNF